MSALDWPRVDQAQDGVDKPVFDSNGNIVADQYFDVAGVSSMKNAYFLL
jgi:hypothetical protein